MDHHSLMTASYLTSMIAKMEHTLGCEIKVVEDKDSRYPCKLEYARNYARLFTVPDPEADEARPFTDFLNPDSGKVVTAWCEPAVAEALRALFAKYEGVCAVEEEPRPFHYAPPRQEYLEPLLAAEGPAPH